jgi:hypothetical protein
MGRSANDRPADVGDNTVGERLDEGASVAGAAMLGQDDQTGKGRVEPPYPLRVHAANAHRCHQARVRATQPGWSANRIGAHRLHGRQRRIAARPREPLPLRHTHPARPYWARSPMVICIAPRVPPEPSVTRDPLFADALAITAASRAPRRHRPARGTRSARTNAAAPPILVRNRHYHDVF